MKTAFQTWFTTSHAPILVSLTVWQTNKFPCTRQAKNWQKQFRYASTNITAGHGEKGKSDMGRVTVLAFIILCQTLLATASQAEPKIQWKVDNKFRLFPTRTIQPFSSVPMTM